MSELIEFNDSSPRSYRDYGGANGCKIGVLIENEPYMLKVYNNISQWEGENACFSEYLGCKIFESCGIPAQKTLLAKYVDNTGQSFPALACKDFCVNGYQLTEFFKTKNSVLLSSDNGSGTDLNNILLSIAQQNYIDNQKLNNFFWDQFVVDALIGNYDRHNGNWGILKNEVKKECVIAPVFDCGSSLFSKTKKEIWESIFQENNYPNLAVLCDKTFSALKIDNKSIVYRDFLFNCQYSDCIDALNRYQNKSKLENIFEIIENTPCLDNFRKDFYCSIIDYRHNNILLEALERQNSLTSNNISSIQLYNARLDNILNEIKEPIDDELSLLYKKTYKQIFQDSIANKAIGTANLDAIVVAKILTKQNKKRLQQVIYDFSPNCYFNKNYVQKVMTKVRNIIAHPEQIKNNPFLKNFNGDSQNGRSSKGRV